MSANKKIFDLVQHIVCPLGLKPFHLRCLLLDVILSVCVSFMTDVLGRMWNLIASGLDHCLLIEDLERSKVKFQLTVFSYSMMILFLQKKKNKY